MPTEVVYPGRTFLWRIFELLKSTYLKETTLNLPELIFCTRGSLSWNPGMGYPRWLTVMQLGTECTIAGNEL